jgi:hypothetical protein
MLYILNFVTIYGKWYIYTSKKECKRITFMRFKKYLKYTLSIDHQVSINKNKQSDFQKQMVLYCIKSIMSTTFVQPIYAIDVYVIV